MYCFSTICSKECFAVTEKDVFSIIRPLLSSLETNVANQWLKLTDPGHIATSQAKPIILYYAIRGSTKVKNTIDKSKPSHLYPSIQRWSAVSNKMQHFLLHSESLFWHDVVDHTVPNACWSNFLLHSADDSVVTWFEICWWKHSCNKYSMTDTYVVARFVVPIRITKESKVLLDVWTVLLVRMLTTSLWVCGLAMARVAIRFVVMDAFCCRTFLVLNAFRSWIIHWNWVLLM